MLPDFTAIQASSTSELPVSDEAILAACAFCCHSTGAERVCSAHKVIHSNARSRLTNANVLTFLYTYANLRILAGMDFEYGDLLNDEKKSETVANLLYRRRRTMNALTSLRNSLNQLKSINTN